MNTERAFWYLVGATFAWGSLSTTGVRVFVCSCVRVRQQYLVKEELVGCVSQDRVATKTMILHAALLSTLLGSAAAQCPEITAAQLDAAPSLPSLPDVAYVATESGNCRSGAPCRLGCRCGYTRSAFTDAVCNTDTKPNRWEPALPSVTCIKNASIAAPRTIFVSTSGDDSQDGTGASPLRTLSKAVSKIESASSCGADTVQLSAGTFDSPFLTFDLDFEFSGEYLGGSAEKSVLDDGTVLGNIPALVVGDIMWSSRWYIESDKTSGIIQDVSSFIEELEPSSEATPGAHMTKFGHACFFTQNSGPAGLNFQTRGHIVNVRNRFDASKSPPAQGATLIVDHAATTFALYFNTDVNFGPDESMAATRSCGDPKI